MIPTVVTQHNKLIVAAIGALLIILGDADTAVALLTAAGVYAAPNKG